MLIGHFTEQPWQDNTTGLMGTQSLDLSISNGVYDPKVGAKLYNRYLDEKIYADQIGFDALMLNEHHSTPFCMQGVTNVGASILARESSGWCPSYQAMALSGRTWRQPARSRRRPADRTQCLRGVDTKSLSEPSSWPSLACSPSRRGMCAVP